MTPIAPTTGRTGDATSARAGAPLRRLGRGGKIDARSNRRRALLREGVGAGAACEDTELAPTVENLERVNAATLCLLNGERSDAGLAPLVSDPKLAAAALEHSQDMVARQYFAHESPEGRDVVDRVRSVGYLDPDSSWTVGENLAWGSGSLSTPRSIMQAWMDSAGHRANILKRDYRQIGMGLALGTPRNTAAGATYTHAFGYVAGRSSASGSSSGAGSSRSTSPSSGNVAGRQTSRSGSRKSRAARRCRARASRGRASSRKARIAARRCRARRASRRR